MVLLRGWGLGSWPGSGASACSPSALGLSLCLRNPSASHPPSPSAPRGAEVTLGQTPPCLRARVDADSGIRWLSRDRRDSQMKTEEGKRAKSPAHQAPQSAAPPPPHLFRLPTQGRA